MITQILLLQYAGDIEIGEYVASQGTAVHGNAVVLEWSPNECNIDVYNPHMLAWQVNMDIQFVDAYVCVVYVASYMMNEKRMVDLLKHVASDDLVKQFRKVGLAFLTHCEVSAREAAYRLLLPMKRLSRSVVFINTNKRNKRVGVVKRPSDLDKLDDDENVFSKEHQWVSTQTC